ncbi:MAG: nitroreductase family protein [Anaerolineae bacterium]|nr:nitroreductase family protein [Anaerolineae bacterium]MBL6966713.1 nitroreductase family protein [Anaerolineales bacterium]
MIENSVIEYMLNRKSIRSYTDEMPSEEVIQTIVRAGQQAPFASQLGSVLMTRDLKNNPFHAPILFIICVDVYRWERIMARCGWTMVAEDLLLILLGMQDATLMAENMVMAAESLGLGSCFLGEIPYNAEEIIEQYKLPPRVFPMVGLTMGYPAESPPPRPRYPLEFVLFEDEYPIFDDELVQRSMDIMDEGYRAQDYYSDSKAMIGLLGDREETFNYDTYGWSEHICRKWGQNLFPRDLLARFERCGFDLSRRE